MAQTGFAAFTGPGFFIGRQVTVFGMTGLNIDPTTGAATPDANGADLKALGVLDKAKFNFHVNHEEISPCTVRIENNVIIQEGVTFDVDEIIPVGGRSNLLQLMAQYDYVRFLFKASGLLSAGVTPGTILQIDMVRGDASFEINRGKCMATMQLKSAGLSFTTLSFQ